MESIISSNFSKACVEILEIIRNMEEDNQNKIPKKLIALFEENRDKSYEYRIDMRKKLKDQKLLNETMGILSLIELKYLATPEEKKQLNYFLNRNENKYQEKLKEKYNYANLFKSQKKYEKNNKKEVSMIEYKENTVLQKIFNRIKKFLKIR